MRVCPACEASRTRFVYQAARHELVRCMACGLVFVSNPPTPAELERAYSFESGYHAIFRDNETEIAYRQAQARKQLSRLGRYSRTGKLLDVGASVGFFVKAAHDAGWNARGIELSGDSASLARDRYGVEVRCGRLEDVEIEHGSLDAVTMWDVIEHVESPRRDLVLARHLVRPGGVLGISTPNLDGWFPKLSYQASKLTGRWDAVEPPWHLSQFTVATLDRLLRSVGWEPLAVTHSAQPLNYTFGRVRDIRSAKRLAYMAAFMPLAAVGPYFRAGDEMHVFARRA